MSLPLTNHIAPQTHLSPIPLGLHRSSLPSSPLILCCGKLTLLMKITCTLSNTWEGWSSLGNSSLKWRRKDPIFWSSVRWARFLGSGRMIICFGNTVSILFFPLLIVDWLLHIWAGCCHVESGTAHEAHITGVDEYNRPDTDKCISLLTTRAGSLVSFLRRELWRLESEMFGSISALWYIGYDTQKKWRETKL